jgi:hypothetical protein
MAGTGRAEAGSRWRDRAGPIPGERSRRRRFLARCRRWRQKNREKANEGDAVSRSGEGRRVREPYPL